MDFIPRFPMSTTFIILRKDKRFWCGPGRWSDEYPDAHVFENWLDATKEAVASTGVHDGFSCVVADYGTEAHRIVLTVEGNILIGGQP